MPPLSCQDFVLQGFAKEMAGVVGTGGNAQMILAGLGVPSRRLSQSGGSIEFWLEVCALLERGAIPGKHRLERLLGAAADLFPGNSLFAPYASFSPRRYASDNPPPLPGDGGQQAQLPTVSQPLPSEPGGPIIMITGYSDVGMVIEQLQRLAQEMGLPGQVEPGYESAGILVFNLTGMNSDQATRLAQEFPNRMLQLGEHIDTITAANEFRDHLIGRLFVSGPDGARFALSNVPATTRLRNIGAGIISQYDPQMWGLDRQGKPRAAVVDIHTPEGGITRLNLDASLHEINISEDATLQVSPESTAGCFPAGTLVRMADGTEKPIEQIKQGDRVLSLDPQSSELTAAKVTAIHRDTASLLLVVNGQLRVTDSHLFFVDGQWLPAGKLSKDNLLRNFNGEDVQLHTIERLKGHWPVYNLDVASWEHGFFAQGLLVHNMYMKALTAGSVDRPDDPFMTHTDFAEVSDTVGRNKPKSSSVHTLRLSIRPIGRMDKSVLAGFHPDFTHGEDKIGIQQDVDALATLLAARVVEPPLAIGLFGDWGSGKTFLMTHIMSRVGQFSSLARQSNLPQQELDYYKHVVQIQLNAWHYIEGNLWASLMEHIFQNLSYGLSDGTAGKGDQQLQQALLQGMGADRACRQRLGAQLQEKENTLHATEIQFKQLQQELAVLEELAKSRTEESRAAHVMELGKQLMQELEDLGIPHANRVCETAEAIQEFGKDFQKTGVQLSSFVSVLANSLKQPWPLILFGVVVLLAMASALVSHTWSPPRLRGLLDWLAGISTLLSGSIFWLKGQQSRIRKGLNRVQQLFCRLSERQGGETDSAAKIQAVTARLSASKSAKEQAEKELRKMQAKWDAPTVEEMLHAFIEDRTACDDYRRHLGIIALIRRDFENLSSLLQQQRDTEESCGDTPKVPTINRIIIYIDDLDRCPPAKVVEVLQAIHLLLAFPLFVVVVAVDVRWLIKALETHYREILGGSGDHEQGRGRENAARAENYLEKIFHIPYWIQPLEDETCKRFLGLLADESRRRAGRDEGSWQQANGPVPSAGAQVDGATKPTVAPTEAGQEELLELTAKALRPPVPAGYFQPLRLELDQQELDFLKILTPVISRTPRTAKRFLNCYRLIRASAWRHHLMANDTTQEAKAMDYKPVMVLLAIVTGAPEIAEDILLALAKANSEDTIATLVDTLGTHTFTESNPDWLRVRQVLDAYAALDQETQTLDPFIRAIPTVAKYSFKMGKLVEWQKATSS